MTFKKWLFEMQNVTYEFSSVQIDAPETLAKNIVKWGKKRIKESDVFVSKEDPEFGREDEIHVTILYGIHSEKKNEVESLLNNKKKFSVKLGKLNVFQNNKFDVLVVDVISKDLKQLNHLLTKNLEYTNNYPNYRPHLTLAYLKKGEGSKYKGDNRWEGTSFDVDTVVFSSKNGTKQQIRL